MLAELEALALRDLRRQTERMRSALARAAPKPKPRGRKDDATEQGAGEGELARARMGATDALELWSKVHAACTLARLEASASDEAEVLRTVLRTGQQEEDEQAQGQDEEKEQDGDGQRHAQRQKDRKHWEHEG